MRQSEEQRRQRRLDRLAWILDSAVPIPGTGLRIGLDGLIGLFPGLGDTVGALVSSYILSEAARLGAPRSVLFKMAWNVALDALLGALPLLGDIFDLTWKANLRNVKLLAAYLETPGRTTAASRLFAWSLIALLLAFVALMVTLGVLLVRRLWQALSG